MDTEKTDKFRGMIHPKYKGLKNMIRFLVKLKTSHEPMPNEEQKQQHDYLYWEYPEYGGQLAIRINNWKGVMLNIMKDNMQWQLFDLNNDIQEQHDVAAQHPDIVRQLDAIVKKEHRTPEVSTFLMPALEEKYNK